MEGAVEGVEEEGTEEEDERGFSGEGFEGGRGSDEVEEEREKEDWLGVGTGWRIGGTDANEGGNGGGNEDVNDGGTEFAGGKNGEENGDEKEFD